MPIGYHPPVRRHWRKILVALAGGADAHIAIVPTASSIEDAGQRYKAIFLDLGAATAEVAVVPDRAAAMGKAAVRALDGATGIFMGGGNQMRLATILGGSTVIGRGAVTSAGWRARARPSRRRWPHGRRR